MKMPYRTCRTAIANQKDIGFDDLPSCMQFERLLERTESVHRDVGSWCLISVDPHDEHFFVPAETLALQEPQ